MNKWYTHYFYGVTLWAIMLAYLVLSSFSLEITPLMVALSVYGVTLEIIMIKFSQNKAVSLQGAVTLLAVVLFNPAQSFFVMLVSFVLENILSEKITAEEIINKVSKKMEEDKKNMHQKDKLNGVYMDNRLLNS